MRLLSKIDLNDLNIFLGLGLLGSGIYLILSLGWALAIVGGLLFGMGLFGAVRSGAND